MQYAAAVKAGKHVFMEKPCCTDAPGYRSLVETNKLADEKNLKVVVGLQRHHQAGYIQGIQEIHDGKLGDIQFLRVYWNGSGGGAHDIGKRPQDDPKEMEFQIRNWGCFLWLYGDNIVEQHVHNIDIANWVMAKDGDAKKAHPVEANGMGGRVNRGNYGDIFDHHFVEFTYADGTKMFSQSPPHPGHLGPGGRVRPRHQGQPRRGRRRRPEAGKRQSLRPGARRPDQGDPQGRRSSTRAGIGAVSSMTAVLGRMATYSGQVVKWDDAVAKGPTRAPSSSPGMPSRGTCPAPTASIRSRCPACTRRIEARVQRVPTLVGRAIDASASV